MKKVFRSILLNKNSYLYIALSFCAAVITLNQNLFATEKQLSLEHKQLSTDLNYYNYLYAKSKKHDFAIGADDEVFWKKGLAFHGIVLIVKDNCDHCRRAEAKLIMASLDHADTVYLIIKNQNTISESKLEEFGITCTPAVFINGKKADGWETSGFLERFTKDCGC